MTETRHLPNINQISVLSASILLAYTLVGFIILPSSEFSVQVPGKFLGIALDPQIIFAILISGLTATGTNWMVRDHPLFKERFAIQHWLLPALTAWVIGLILFQQPFSIIWWIIFAFGGPVLILIMVAEYIIVDPNDVRHAAASIGLTALSYALFLTLAITIRSIEARIFLLTPTIAIASGLTSLRTLHLQQNKWEFVSAAVIATIVGELSSPLFYFRIEPITFGLILLGPSYALTSLLSSILRRGSRRQMILEPLIILAVVWGIAIII